MHLSTTLSRHSNSTHCLALKRLSVVGHHPSSSIYARTLCGRSVVTRETIIFSTRQLLLALPYARLVTPFWSVFNWPVSCPGHCQILPTSQNENHSHSQMQERHNDHPPFGKGRNGNRRQAHDSSVIQTLQC